MPFEGKTRPVS